MNPFKQLLNDKENVIEVHRQHNMPVVNIAKKSGRHHTTVFRYPRAKFLWKPPKRWVNQLNLTLAQKEI